MHKGGFSDSGLKPLLWGEAAGFAAVGGTRPPRCPWGPEGGLKECEAYLVRA
jgi:hypothetical protein